jgi:hypothetical protein
MPTPKYLEAFRRAARESQTREKSVLSEKSPPSSCRAQPEEHLFSLTSLISHPEPSQNPPTSEVTVCAVCGAGQDLWHVDTATGAVLVHEACARFLPQPKPAEPTAAYQSVSAAPDGTGCRVEIVELPASGRRYAKVFSVLQLRPPAYIPEDRWRQCIEDGKRAS